ncbi:MAG: HAD family hydrolase [Clostridiaceae bacterium]
MKYKNILFDLDGTLTDSKEGITRSVQYALSKFGISVDSLDQLNNFLGPPLKDAFMEYFNFSEEEAETAVKYYRERFKDKGIFENQVYEGIEKLLIKLKDNGLNLFIATSKPRAFADRILKHFNLFSYFDAVIGSEFDGTRNKKGDVISYVISEYKLDNKDDIIMVGDRRHDVIGAKENGIDVIGVTYGYGSIDELKGAGASYLAGSPEDIFNIIKGE